MYTVGMYTELVLAVELKAKTPEEVIEVLKFMINPSMAISEEEVEVLKSYDALFRTERWQVMLRMGSYYFSGQPSSVLQWDDISNAYHLSVRFNIKNYTGEIEAFLAYLAPHIYTSGFIGYSRYEEDKDPTLIYVTEEGMRFFQVGDRR